MRVLVCGSREYPDMGSVDARLDQLPEGVVINVGGARGVDTIAERWGYRGLGSGRCGGVTVSPANWHIHGKRAGIVRNLHMLDQEPDLVLAFWDATSAGTRHTIEEARRRGITVEVIEA